MMQTDICEQSRRQLARIENTNDELKNLLGELVLTNSFQFSKVFGI